MQRCGPNCVVIIHIGFNRIIMTLNAFIKLKELVYVYIARGKISPIHYRISIIPHVDTI